MRYAKCELCSGSTDPELTSHLYSDDDDTEHQINSQWSEGSPNQQKGWKRGETIHTVGPQPTLGGTVGRYHVLDLGHHGYNIKHT